jgi:adenine C2-methylase RlmN of 23S rRNA A2503 and tRNA A37
MDVCVCVCLCVFVCVHYIAAIFQVVKAVTCQDETTTKLLIRLQDGHLVETVVMRYSHRSTVCVSSQVGCRMACRFCSTGTMGLLGHLTAGEMCEQVHSSVLVPFSCAPELPRSSTGLAGK